MRNFPLGSKRAVLASLKEGDKVYVNTSGFECPQIEEARFIETVYAGEYLIEEASGKRYVYNENYIVGY